ncbi:MAG: PQQ-like beta-propeller repeat protein, partial [Planctomycetes bacterium]|nr:PQQ-like beta-propeller repeat protein [Planctomycetota bacterium]
VWKYTGIDRSISTVSIADGLVFAADYTGMVHCLDADTGEVYWVHDTESAIWASTLVVDGKLYIGTEDGQMIILKAQKELKVVQEIEMGAPIYSSAVAANGVLYVATMTHLYAIAGGN